MDKQKEQKGAADYRWLPEFLKAFAEMSGWIAIPIIASLYFGQWLDGKFQTGNLYFFGLTALAFILSCIGLTRTAMKYLRRAEITEADKKTGDKKLKETENKQTNGDQPRN